MVLPAPENFIRFTADPEVNWQHVYLKHTYPPWRVGDGFFVLPHFDLERLLYTTYRHGSSHQEGWLFNPRFIHKARFGFPVGVNRFGFPAFRVWLVYDPVTHVIVTAYPYWVGWPSISVLFRTTKYSKLGIFPLKSIFNNSTHLEFPKYALRAARSKYAL